MDFDWDETKSSAKLAERGFEFAFAAFIFEGSTLEAVDDRRHYGETRIKAVGETGGYVLAVIYTDRGDVRRIISARLANRKERAQWQSFASR